MESVLASDADHLTCYLQIPTLKAIGIRTAQAKLGLLHSI